MRPADGPFQRLLRPQSLGDLAPPLTSREHAPVLPSTLLGMELLLQRPALDLGAAARLLCADPGALLHLFGLIGEEFPDVAERPLQLTGCLASLSQQRLLHRLAAAPHSGYARQEYVRFAAHAAAVGRSAQTVAESLGLPGELALLAGVLHELGSLPVVLGWTGTACPTSSTLSFCDQLAQQYALPTDLRSALQDVHCERSTSVWTAVLAAAHDLLTHTLNTP